MPASPSSVPAPLAIAKATPPSPIGKVSRSRVNARVDDALLQNGAVWLTGPAGAGKSSAAATYLSSCSRSAFWYQIDTRDQDPGAFFHGMTAALGQWTGCHDPMPIYTEGAVATFARSYFAELFQRLGKDPILVLDDCHEVDDDCILFTILAHGLDTLPDGAAVLFLSRNTPPPALARPQLNGHLAVVGNTELRATADEVIELARVQSGRHVAPAEAERIVETVDGWFAALSLALSSETPTSRLRGLRTGAPAEVLSDYFAEEVFDAALPAEQELMLRTAFMDRFTAADAAYLADEPNAAAILRLLVRRHSFLDEYLQTEPFYRFHPLFREFLQRQATHVLGADETGRLQVNAAKRIEAGSEPADAIPHYLACGDWNNAIRLLEAESADLMSSGRHATLARWIAMLPESKRNRHSWIVFWEAQAHLPTDPSRASRGFLRALHAFEAADNRRGQILSLAGATDAVFFAHSNADQFEPLIDRLSALVAGWPGFPSDAEEERVMASFCHALLMRRPEHPLFKTMQRQLSDAVDHTDDPVQLTLLGSHLGTCAFWGGDLNTMQLLTDRLLPLAGEPWMPPLLGALIRMMGAFSAWLHADTERCHAIVDDYEQARDRNGVVLWDAHLAGARAAAALTAGDIPGAGRLLKAMRDMLAEDRLLDVGLYYLLLCWYDMLRGEFVDARRHAELHQRVSEQFGATLPLALAHLVRSQVAHRFGQAEESEHHLQVTAQTAERMDSDLVRFLCLTSRAFYAVDTGYPNRAFPILEEAFALGARRHYVNAPLFLPDLMGQLCALALEHDIEPEYARHLVERRRLPAPDPDVPRWPWPLEVRALGGFEIRLGGTPLPPGRKLPERPLAILKYLIAHGGEADRGRLLDALWPDSEGDAAHSAFSTNISRLRRLLGIAEAIRVSSGTVTLDPRYCRLDTSEFERLSFAPISTARLEEAMALYRGPLFGNLDNTPWAAAYSEHLRSLLAGSAVTLAQQRYEAGDTEAAERAIEQALGAEPLSEQLYYRVMRFHNDRGETERSLALCRRGCQVFDAGENPAAEERLATFYRKLAG